MLKRVAIGVAVLFFVALLVLGWEKTYSYVAGTRRVLNAEADDRVPLRLERARIESLIQKEHDGVLAFEDRVAVLEGQRDGMAREIEQANRKLAAEQEVLKRIKDLLDEGRDQYAIGRLTYSRAEVNADALQRLEEVRQMQEAIGVNQSALDDLDAAIKQGFSATGEARRRLGQLGTALAQLKQREVNAETRMQIVRLINSIEGAPLSGDSGLENAMRNYERQVSAMERRATMRLAPGAGPSRIDYSAVIPAEDASAEIDQFLSAAPPREPVAAAAGRRPPADRVLEDLQ